MERLTASPQLHVAALAAGRRYMEISFGRLWASFQVGEVTLITQTIDGDFPDYHSIIPKTFKHSVVFDAGEGYRALRQLAPYATSGRNILRLSWRQNFLTFQASSQDLGEASTSIDATTKGRATHTAYNLRYLLEILRDKDGRVLLEVDQPTGPGRFTHHASPDILVMAMATAEAREAAAAEESAVDPQPEGELPKQRDGVAENADQADN